MNIKILFTIFAFILLLGCSKPDRCVDPFVRIGDICCHDDNNNSICDIEDAADAESEGPAPEQGSETSPEPEVKVEDPVTSEPDGPAPEPVKESKPLQAEATLIANRFAKSWEMKQYNVMYSLLTKKLKNIKTSEEFNAIMELNPSHKRIEEVKVLDIDFTSDTKGTITFKFSTNVKSYETTDSKIIFDDDSWKIDGMIDVFYVDTYGGACGGFSKDFNRQACAKDLAIMVKDPEYCDKAKCHYAECLTEVNGGLTKEQKVHSCNLCPPLGKTNKECITDVAIETADVKVCNEISESSYADRYCKCWGGYAKAKGTSAHCNLITDPEYKDLCMTGYEGGRC